MRSCAWICNSNPCITCIFNFWGLMMLTGCISKSGCFSDSLCKAVCAGVNCYGFIGKSEYFSVINLDL